MTPSMEHRRTRAILLLSIATLSFFAFFSERLGITTPHNIPIWMGWLLYIAYIFSLYLQDYRFIASSFYQIFYFVGILASLTLIYQGGYMYEIAKSGSPNGSFWIALTFSVAGLHYSHRGFAAASRATHREYAEFWPQAQRILSWMLIAGTILAASAILLLYGTPSESGVNRVQYWGDIAPARLSYIKTVSVLTIYLVFIEIFSNETKSKTKMAFFIAFLLYLWIGINLFGEKFSLFVIYISVGLIVSARFFSQRSLSVVFLIVLAAFFCMTLYVASIYSSAGSGPRFIVTRLLLQGQVLWSVLQEQTSFLTGGIFRDCGTSCDYLSDPRRLVAHRYLPSQTFEANKVTGTSLTGFMPSVIVLYLGIPASLLLHALVSYAMGRLQFHAVYWAGKHAHIYAVFLFSTYYFVLIFWFVANENVLAGAALGAMLAGLYRLLFLRRRFDDHAV